MNDISHLVLMIHSSADRVHDDLLNQLGYLSRLNKVAEKGGFISAGSLEAMQLLKARQYLIDAAEALGNIQRRLMENDIPNTFIENIQERMREQSPEH